MKESHQFDISSLLDGIPHSAVILDTAYRIVQLNRLMEATTGYTRDEVAGLHGELVIRSNIGNTRGQLYEKVMQTGEAVSVVGDIINCNRRKISVLCTVSSLKDQAGRPCGLLVVVEDISATVSDSQKKFGTMSEPVDFIGYSPKIQKVFDLIPLMAQTDASVMITGETGTGKDRVAEIIHENSSRSRYPFIKINCGALPAGLLESELFGHVKGAFTGATRNKAGMFELAHKGTLFLTEIGDMPLPLQVKLLSVLDDKEFVPVGGEEKKSVDVRIIAATHRPLREQIRNNEFREDLFYRLHVLHVHLPALREREEDVRLLLDHFLQKFTLSLNKTIVGFSPDAMQTLLRYSYPGNIRELKNIVEYAVNICKKKKIGVDLLPPYVLESPPSAELEEEQSVEKISGQSAAGTSIQSSMRNNGKESWEEIERAMIVDCLRENGGNRTRTAEQLGWGRMKLWRKMKHYGLI